MNKQNNPKVSIIMGVYNDEKFLSEAISSILTQTYNNFEFIICDDCSTDNSEKIIKSFNDSRIVFIKNERNQGLGNTLNHCLKIAKGEYIARMDSDDRSLSNRLEKQVNYLDCHENVSVIGSQAYFIDEHGKRFKKFCRPLTISLKDTVKQTLLIHPSTMFRKRDVMMVGGYTVNPYTKRAEDYDLWCKLCYKGYTICNLSDFLFEYRENKKAYKKRKYHNRIEEYHLKKFWIKKALGKKRYYIYAVKPLIVGLIPKSLMIRRKIKS